MFFTKNKKGQSILEASVIMNIILLMFFGMIMYSTYVYDRIIILFAANLAVDEAIGKIPDKKYSKNYRKIEELMRQKAAGAASLGIFLESPITVAAKVTKKRDTSAGNINISCKVDAKYTLKLPLISAFTPNNILSHRVDVDYHVKNPQAAGP